MEVDVCYDAKLPPDEFFGNNDLIIDLENKELNGSESSQLLDQIKSITADEIENLIKNLEENPKLSKSGRISNKSGTILDSSHRLLHQKIINKNSATKKRDTSQLKWAVSERFLGKTGEMIGTEFRLTGENDKEVRSVKQDLKRSIIKMQKDRIEKDSIQNLKPKEAPKLGTFEDTNSVQSVLQYSRVFAPKGILT